MKANFYGYILLIAWLIVSIQLIFAQVPHVILSFCYIGILIAAIGFLFRKPSFVYAYVAVALIAQVPFSIDLMRAYMGLEQFIGLVTYDPEYFTLAGRIVDFSVHILVLPFVIFGMYSIKPPKYKYFVKWYIFLLSGMIIISSFFGRNCVEVGCFEALSYGNTVLGHLAYLSIIALIGPLIIGYYIRKIHIWALNKSKKKSS